MILVCQPVGSFYVLYDEAYENDLLQRGELSREDEKPFR